MAKLVGSLELATLASSPATPASGYLKLYAKTDDNLYYKNDAGVEILVGNDVNVSGGGLAITDPGNVISLKLNSSGGLVKNLGTGTDELGIGATSVTNAMLAGSIADSKLSTITTANKVSGSAVQLAGSGGLEDSTGLRIASSGVTNAMLAGSITGDKLASNITISTSSSITADSFSGDGSSLTNLPTVGSADSMVLAAKKATAGTITKGTPIFISGYSSPDYLVEAADADDAGKMPAIGVAGASITDSAAGSIIIAGKLTALNTSGFSVGDELYVSDSSTLTNVKPTGATKAIQKIGQVLVSDATVGVIQVFGAGRSNDVPNIASANLWVGNGSGVATAVALSGDVTMSNTGAVTIAATSVENSMLAGSIADSKLNTITTANKVSGSAVQLAGSGGLEDSTGLQIAASGVTNAMLAGSIADSKLSTITTANKVSGSAVQVNAAGAITDSTGLFVNVSGALEISGNSIIVSASGITNAMLGGSIADSKLSTITTANKVSGSAVQLNAAGAITDDTGLKVAVDGTTIEISSNALRVKADSIGATQLDETGTFDFTSGTVSVATPTSDNHAANKAYVDATSTGLDVKGSVRIATAASVADLSEITVADIDGEAQGITLVEGDRVLVKDTASADGVEGVDAKRNGIYTVGAVTTGTAALTRSEDADNSPAGEVTSGMFCFVEEGDYSDAGFVLSTNNPITLDTTGLTFTQFSGAGQVTAGAGLTKDGNTLNVGAGSGITVNANDIALASSSAGAGLAYNTGVLSVNVDDSSLEVTVDTLNVKALGITNAMLAGSIADSKLSTITTANKVSGSAVQLGAGGGIEDSTGLQINKASNLTISGSWQFSDLRVNEAVAVTATSTELNLLDGVTATTAELNILDGVTSTAAELNVLDGATLSTTELNYVDGVTSAIQTQIDNKPDRFEHTQSSANVTWNVAHNLGEKYVNVIVVNSSDEVIIPDTISYTDTNNLVVTLGVADTGKVVCIA